MRRPGADGAGTSASVFAAREPAKPAASLTVPPVFLLLCCQALCLACALPAHHPFAPGQPDLAGWYVWESAEGTDGTLILHTPADSAARDTLLTHDGRIVECNALAADALQCGGFTFSVSAAGVMGESERCRMTFPPDRVINGDPSIAPGRSAAYAAQACQTRPLRMHRAIGPQSPGIPWSRSAGERSTGAHSRRPAR